MEKKLGTTVIRSSVWDWLIPSVIVGFLWLVWDEIDQFLRLAYPLPSGPVIIERSKIFANQGLWLTAAIVTTVLVIGCYLVQRGKRDVLRAARIGAFLSLVVWVPFIPKATTEAYLWFLPSGAEGLNHAFNLASGFCLLVPGVIWLGVTAFGTLFDRGCRRSFALVWNVSTFIVLMFFLGTIRDHPSGLLAAVGGVAAYFEIELITVPLPWWERLKTWLFAFLGFFLLSAASVYIFIGEWLPFVVIQP